MKGGYATFDLKYHCRVIDIREIPAEVFLALRYKQGVQEANIKTARRMLEMDSPITFVQKATGLPLSLLKELRSELKK